MKKFFLRWILIGLVLRLVIIPFTVHPDIRAFDLGAYLISQKGEVLTFYDYLSHLNFTDPLLRNYKPDFFIYPPLAYLVPAAFMALLGPLYNFPFNDVFLREMEKTYQTVELYKTLFLLKLPYLFFDFLLAYLLYRIFTREKGRLAFKLWMFNPVTFYATFAIGQIEIFPTLLVVAALWLALKGKKEVPVLLLGIGGAFKLFPLLFLPIFVLVLNRKFWQRIRLLMIGLLPYLLIIAPYLTFSPMYRQSAFLAGQAEKMLYMKLPLSGAEYLSVFGLGYFGLLFLAAKWTEKKEVLWKLGLALMLLFFSVTHYHPQWFLWLTPFLIWDLVVYGKRHLPYIAVLLSCYLVILLSFESSLHVGLFVPVNPSLAHLFGGIEEVVGRFCDPFQFKSFVRSLFAATAAFLVYLNLSAARRSRP